MNKNSNRIPPKSAMKRAASLLKLLSHPDRLGILLFVEEKEEKVTAIQKFLGLTQAMTSQHLKVLYDTGYLIKKRSGTSIYYLLSPDQGAHILPSIKACEEIWHGNPVRR